MPRKKTEAKVIDLMAALKEALRARPDVPPEPVEPIGELIDRITEPPTTASHEG